MYQYQAVITRVIDGDTAEAMIDLGFDTWAKKTVRLWGVDAPEVRGKTRSAGLAAKARLVELVEGKKVLLESKAWDKYRRAVAVLTAGGTNVNELLVAEGLAVRYMDS